MAFTMYDAGRADGGERVDERAHNRIDVGVEMSSTDLNNQRRMVDWLETKNNDRFLASLASTSARVRVSVDECIVP